MGDSSKQRRRRRGRAAAGSDAIRLEGVRVHNLDGIDVEIPRNRLVVISGVSGSGKSSLAFDTLYAEGRRRYVECLSTYFRQFLERMPRPDLDAVNRLPPAVAVERAVPAAQARSTVGSSTEIHDYLRLLFARVGRTRCIGCGRAVRGEPPGHVARAVVREGGIGTVTFQADPPGKGRSWSALRRELERDGFVRVWQDGKAVRLEQADWRGGPIEVAVDRLSFERSKRTRLAEAVETAYRFGHDRCSVHWSGGRLRRFSRRLHCPDCDREYRPPEPRLFSPNSPLGACAECQGFGRSIQPDLERIIPDAGRTLAEGPVDPWNKPAYRSAYSDLRRAGRRVGLRWDVPYRALPRAQRRLVEEGGQGFFGIRGFFDWLETKKYKLHVRVFLSRYRAYRPCAACGGRRLRPEALGVEIARSNIARLAAVPVAELLEWVRRLRLTGAERAVAEPILHELRQRLDFLVEVGLGYLSLDRSSRTLSGGEAQRIQLARATRLVPGGHLCTCSTSHPSGLHPLRRRATGSTSLCHLRDMGNTVVVVEHDPRVMERGGLVRSIWAPALEPTAGGHVLYQGPPVSGIELRPESSATGGYLDGAAARSRSSRTRRCRSGSACRIELAGASIHNLRDRDRALSPQRALTVVTGVSGIGQVEPDPRHASRRTGRHHRLARFGAIDSGPYRTADVVTEGLTGVELVDQSPIGKQSAQQSGHLRQGLRRYPPTSGGDDARPRPGAEARALFVQRARRAV